MTSLDPGLAGDTRELWRACEAVMAEHASGWSLDRIVAVRDHSWFGEPGQGRKAPPVPLHRYLRRLARSHLHRRTPVTEVRSSTEWSQLDAITHYRWLVFALPEDLLLAALEVEPPPMRVDLDPPLLRRRLLDLGVAEIHHHLGGGMDFSLLWASALAHLASPDLDPESLHGPGMPFDEGRKMIPWLLVAAVARITLAEFLIRRRSGAAGAPNSLEDLLTWIDGHPSWHAAQRRLLHQSLIALRRGRDAELPDFFALRRLYGELHPQALGGRPQSLVDVWKRCDPIAVRLGLRTANAGERWLVHQGLAYLAEAEAHGQEDALFGSLFWQVLRLRIRYYRTLVLRPMTAGLQWFTRFFDRIWVLRPPLDDVATEASFQTAGGGHVITSLEGRFTLGKTRQETAEKLRTYLASWDRVLETVGSTTGGPGAEPEFGLVAHLVKIRDPKKSWAAGAPPAFWSGTHAEPQRKDGQFPGRYADYLADQATQVREFGEMLRAVPLALWLARGLDMAADELSVPTWVLVPLLREARDQACLAAADPRSRGAEPPRVTAHVGEDFRHLGEGMRRIWEVVQYILGNRGRLGHATALGVEPRTWAESVGSVMMPAEERLWDLVWEWRLYTGFRLTPEFLAEAPSGRLGRLENQIAFLTTEVFGKSATPAVLAECHHVLHRFLSPPVADVVRHGRLSYAQVLRHLRPDKVQFYFQVIELLSYYCTDQATFQRGQQLVDVTLDSSEIDALFALQNALRRGIAHRGIVVEINPSSNLLIGDLLDLRHHPVLRLFPPEGANGPPPVPIAIGSDDPLTFNTHLLREYALLFDAARAAGYPERVVQDWLERIRATGLDARFTLPWRPSARKMTKEILEALDAFLQKPLARRKAGAELRR